MNHPKGSPLDILLRLRSTEREIKQILRDLRYVNEHNPNFADCLIDTGRYVVQIEKTRQVIKRVQELIEAGEPTLPSDILAPLCEPW